jgi:hypothetical protein
MIGKMLRILLYFPHVLLHDSGLGDVDFCELFKMDDSAVSSDEFMLQFLQFFDGVVEGAILFGVSGFVLLD